MRKILFSLLLTGMSSVMSFGQTPAITSVTPDPAMYSSQITIHGSGFGAAQGSGVAYLYNSATPVQAQVVSWSDDTVVIQAAAANGGGACHVVVNQNGVDSNSAWAHILQPEIDNASPPSAPIGSQITLTGLRFGASEGTGYAEICHSGTCNPLAVSNWSDTQIVATIPTGAHSGILRVWQEGMVSSTQPNFTILNTPTITSISPEPAMYGSQITINGSGFGATQGSGDLLLYPGPVHPSILSWSDSAIVFQHVATDGAGALLAEVDQSGMASNQVFFHVLQPEIDSVSPASAALGAQITLSGLRFGAVQDVGFLELCAPYAETCTPLTVNSWTDTQVTATIPAGAYSGTLHLLQDGVTSNSVDFTVTDSPTIFSVSPEPATYGADITIQGSGFGASQGTNGAAYLSYSATPAQAQVVSWSDSAIVVRHSFTANGGGAMHVMVQQNGVSSNLLWSHANPPQIAGISPTTGPWGSLITISGSNFGPTAPVSGTVSLGGATLPVVSWSDTAITATVSDGLASGAVAVSLGGYTVSGDTFTVAAPAPVINDISPANGPIGTTITITGANFGSAPQTPMIGNIALTGVTWSDTSIQGTVPSNAKTGYIWFQSGADMIDGPRFIITTGRSEEPTITLSPSAVSMVVGDTRTLDALDPDGSPVLGATWGTSDSSIISLSTDDPPVLTALATGTAMITAGSSSATVTVYEGPDLPDGTVKWSAPGDGSGVGYLIPAVPSPTGVADVFSVQQSGNVQAITAEGHVAWTAAIVPGAKLLADFSGGFAAIDSAGITKYDGMTGQPHPTYAFTNPFTPVGTPTDPSSEHFVAPHQAVVHTDGTEFVIDGDTLVGMDPKTGQPKFSIPLEHAIDDERPGDLGEGDSCSGEPVYYHESPATTRSLTVAGDGYAYLPYSYGTHYTDYSADCLVAITHDESHSRVLRIGADGQSSKIQITDSSLDTSRTTFSNDGWGYDYSTTQSGQVGDSLSIITNADSGTLISWHASTPAYCASVHENWTLEQITETGCVDATTSYHLTTTSGDNVSSTTTINVSNQSGPVAPALQREDGVFIGTVPQNSGSSTNTSLVVFDAAGNVKWTKSENSGSAINPLYALADGSTVYQHIDGSTKEMVTVDSNGQELSRVADTPTSFSWKGAYQLGSTDSVERSLPPLAASFAAWTGGNPTQNSTHLREHEFGIFWCENNGCTDGSNNVLFGYAKHGSNLPLVDFGTAHPVWTYRIRNATWKAFNDSFLKFPVRIVLGRAKNTVEIDGDPPTIYNGKIPCAETHASPSPISWAHYEWNLYQAQIALNFDFDTVPTDPQINLALMNAIGTGLGHNAAHEIGHQLNIDGMDQGSNLYLNGPSCEGGDAPMLYTGDPAWSDLSSKSLLEKLK